METAVSLIQDANPTLGERVAIVGQGLIGVLTAAVLADSGFDVTVIDISKERLDVSKSFSPSVQTWNPSSSESSSINSSIKFDVCIELTGRLKGLQTAIDNTGYGGRVIVGSWFSGSEEVLRLGTIFHRSHISIKASQVMEFFSHPQKTTSVYMNLLALFIVKIGIQYSRETF